VYSSVTVHLKGPFFYTQMAVTKHMTPEEACIGWSDVFLINKIVDWL